ncbi:MAG: hypothetical protein KA974_01615 [Saprospiraceae bacterium]|nr:hypothetical protein [Saprospiraceae bacterium]MBP7679698.1 hypothetical protein [Saprospiraceae bacterium]
MFTINIYLRFALIILSLVGGVILAFTVGFWYALPILLVGIVLLVGYILLGTVQSAAELLNSDMNVDAAEKRLSLTLKPEWLFYLNRSYYYMLKGTIATMRKDTNAAEEMLNKALQTGFQSDDERAGAYLQLISININKGKWQQAQLLYNKCKELNIKQSMLKEQMKQIDQAFKNKGAMQIPANRAQMMAFSGKRRRPPMR